MPVRLAPHLVIFERVGVHALHRMVEVADASPARRGRLVVQQALPWPATASSVRRRGHAALAPARARACRHAHLFLQRRRRVPPQVSRLARVILGDAALQVLHDLPNLLAPLREPHHCWQAHTATEDATVLGRQPAHFPIWVFVFTRGLLSSRPGHGSGGGSSVIGCWVGLDSYLKGDEHPFLRDSSSAKSAACAHSTCSRLRGVAGQTGGGAAAPCTAAGHRKAAGGPRKGGRARRRSKAVGKRAFGLLEARQGRNPGESRVRLTTLRSSRFDDFRCHH